jgi:hypothetical protein
MLRSGSAGFRSTSSFWLPAVRRSVPEVYGALHSHRSWTRLLLQFIFDHQLSLFSRTVRTERGQRPAAANASVAA